MKYTFRCVNCVYWYAGRDEDYPTCQCQEMDGFAPCELYDNDNDYSDEDYGYYDDGDEFDIDEYMGD